jgi:MSHA pilin protein MshD
MCILHSQRPQGVCRWAPRCLHQDRPEGERLAASSLRGYAATHSQRGISLIELIMFIVIVSVALAGILLVMNVTTKSSADPLIHKQAIAIAESLLEEVELMPFTWCDPNDINAASAVSAASCAGLDQNKAGAALTSPTPNTETRYSTSDPFDNVADYGNFSMAAGAIMDITNNNIGLTGYKADIAINRGALSGLPADAALRITVMVTGPDNLPVVLEGIRTRYSPNP